MSSDLREDIEVLLIDDTEKFLNLAREYFEEESRIQLTTELSAEKGLELIEQGDFDVVVADYMMPEMDGLDLLKTLRKKGNSIPFILLTGKGEEEVAMEALNKGADRYHIKRQDAEKQFEEITRSIVEEFVGKRSEKELKTLQTWIKNTLSRD